MCVYEIIEQTADHYHWDIKGEAWNDIRKLGVTDAVTFKMRTMAVQMMKMMAMTMTARR